MRYPSPGVIVTSVPSSDWIVIVPAMQYPVCRLMHLSVWAMDFTWFDQRQPGSILALPIMVSPIVTISETPFGNERVSSALSRLFVATIPTCTTPLAGLAESDHQP